MDLEIIMLNEISQSEKYKYHMISLIQERDPQNSKLPSGGQAPCSTGFPCLVRVLGTHLYQCLAGVVVRGCIWLKWIFIWRIFQRVCPFHNRWFTSAPAQLSVEQFLTKSSMTPMPHPPYSTIHAPSNFFVVSLDEKSPQEYGLSMWKRWNKKQQKH